MDKFKYLKPAWWTASLILLMLLQVTKGVSKYVDVNFSFIPGMINRFMVRISD